VFAAQPDPAPVKVALIDDHYLIHESVAHKLSGHPEYQLVATGTAGEELEPIIERHHPKVVLMDLGIPAKVGTTIRQAGRFQVLPAIRRMREKYPDTEFIILSGDADATLVRGAVEVDAKGYLLKDDELSTSLVQAIHAVSRGGVYFSKEVPQLLRANNRNRASTDLTERQLEVLYALCQSPNSNYAELAQNLAISENTLNNHLRQIFAKLKVSNVTAAVVKAIQAGLVPAHILGMRENPD
jgi:two-component system response regulator DegU